MLKMDAWRQEVLQQRANLGNIDLVSCQSLQPLNKQNLPHYDLSDVADYLKSVTQFPSCKQFILSRRQATAVIGDVHASLEFLILVNYK